MSELLRNSLSAPFLSLSMMTLLGVISDDLHDRFVAALLHASRLWRLAFERQLKEYGLSQPAWLAFAAVATAATAPSQSSVAHSLGLACATMVPMIDRLVAAGLVTRVPSPGDKRVKLVKVTSKGAALYLKVNIEVGRMHQDLLAGIDLTGLSTALLTLGSVQAIADCPG